MKSAALASLCALLLAPATGHLTAPVAATFVAVTAPDGTLTPIAVFDGREWWNAWPWAAESDEVKALPVPASLDAIPADWLPPGVIVPREWRVLLHSGGTRRTTAVRPVRATVDDLMDTISITTTLRRGNEYGEAIAISGPGVLGRFVPLSDRENARVFQRISGRIVTVEEQAIRRWRDEDKEDGATAALTQIYKVPTPDGLAQVTQRPPGYGSDYSLTRASDRVDDKTYYYLRGEKLLKVSPHDECLMNLSTEGLVVIDRSGRLAEDTLSSHAYREYCGDAAEWSVPLATVRVGTRLLWILRVSVEDGSDYILFDPRVNSSVELRGLWGLREK